MSVGCVDGNTPTVTVETTAIVTESDMATPTSRATTGGGPWRDHGVTINDLDGVVRV